MDAELLPTSFPIRVAHSKTIQIPSIGFGTWAAGSENWCKNAVLAALKAGYRHIDCAWSYGVSHRTEVADTGDNLPGSHPGLSKFVLLMLPLT
jgi:diketogulonate reductase-like aldo/keto reductase